MAHFVCGAECGIVTAGASGGARHWSAVSGTPTSQTAIARNGGRAYRFNPTTSTAYLDRDAANGTTQWNRFYVYFGSLPSADTFIFRQVVNAADLSHPHIKYRTATHDLVLNIGSSGGATAVPVTTGVWYRIEVEADVSAATRFAGWTVDGVDKGSVTAALTATTISSWRVGIITNSATADIYFDDMMSGSNLAEYPIGAGQVVGLYPNADGTHSFDTAGDFIYGAAGGNIAPGATDTWSFIDHTLDGITDFLNAANAATSEYLEFQFTDMPAGTTTINAMELVSAHHAATTSANLQSLRVVDGATLDDTACSDVDFSQTSLCYNSHNFGTAPSTPGVNWTLAKTNAVKVRWASSFTAADVTPDAYLDGLLWEVDAVITPVTRLYFPWTIPAAFPITPAVDAGWARSIGTFNRQRLRLTKEDSSNLGVSAFFGSNSTSDTCWGQWISAPLDVNQTINGVVNLVIRCQEGGVAENAHLAYVLRVIKPDLTVRGTLKSQLATSTEFSTSGGTRIFSGVVTSSVAALAGDRVVMELGVHGVTPANLNAVSLEWGADMDGADYSLAADQDNGSVGWLEIGQILTFDIDPFFGLGALSSALPSSIAATGTLIFNGTGALVKSLSTSITTTGVESFNATGALVKTFSSSITGSGFMLFSGSGVLVKTLGKSMVGVGTNTPDVGAPPPPPPPFGNGRGGKVRFINQPDEKEPEEPKPTPKAPPVPEAGELPDTQRGMDALFGPVFEPEMWMRMARFRAPHPVFQDRSPEAPPTPLSERFMQHIAQELGIPGQSQQTDHEQFLADFLRQLGMEM